MTEKKERILSYRRAQWLIDQPDSISLSTCINQATAKLKSVGDRTISRAGGQDLSLASLKSDSDGGYYLHITAETPGEAASVVPTASKSGVEIQVSTTPAPPGTEFMDGDAFVYVRGNDVCLCTTGLHDSSIRYFLGSFFVKAKIRHDAGHFELEKVANINKVKFLQTQGVKEIELRAVLYEATAHYHRRKNQPQGLLGAVGKGLKAILGREHDVNEDALKVSLTLVTDKRRKGLTLGERRIKDLAVDLVKSQEDTDEYVIVTKTGERIGPKEIFLRSKVAIDAKGKSVERNKAWKELLAFYNKLASAGALEE